MPSGRIRAYESEGLKAGLNIFGNWLLLEGSGGSSQTCSQLQLGPFVRLQIDVRLVWWLMRHSPSESNFVDLRSQVTSRQTMEEGHGMIHFGSIWLGAPKTIGKRPTPTLQGLGSRVCSALIEHGLAEAPRVRISSNGAGVLCTSLHAL